MSVVPVCKECCRALTDEEAFYYTYRCEQCERDNHERIQAWRGGAEDAELDAFYSAPEPTKH